MRKAIFKSSIFIFLLVITSCKFGVQNIFFRAPLPDDRSSVLIDLENPLAAVTSGGRVVSDKIHFLVVTDLHYDENFFRPEEAVLKDFDSPDFEKPDFFILLGDLTEAGQASSFEDCNAFFDRLRLKINRPGYYIPDYAVVGNHDLYNDGYFTWKNKRKTRGDQGNTFYRFKTVVTGSTGEEYERSWYFIDSASSTLGIRQFSALKKAIKSDTNPKFIFSHYPLFFEQGMENFFKWSDVRERAVLINLFDKNNVNMFFSGHWHNGGGFSFGNFREICFSSFMSGAHGKRESCWYYVTVDEVNKNITVDKRTLFSGETRPVISSTVYDFQGKVIR